MEHYAIRLEARQVAEPDFPYNREVLSNPFSVTSFCKTLQESDVEKFVAIHLSSTNIVNCIQVFTGSNCYCSVPIRDIIKGSLLSNSTSLILVHNHPSGGLLFSKLDLLLTEEVAKAAKLFEIRLLDHLLIAGLNYQSMQKNYPHILKGEEK